MKHSAFSRFNVWGHNLLNKLKGVSRKRRKRQASKKRRAAQKEEYRRHNA